MYPFSRGKKPLKQVKERGQGEERPPRRSKGKAPPRSTQVRQDIHLGKNGNVEHFACYLLVSRAQNGRREQDWCKAYSLFTNGGHCMLLSTELIHSKPMLAYNGSRKGGAIT